MSVNHLKSHVNYVENEKESWEPIEIKKNGYKLHWICWLHRKQSNRLRVMEWFVMDIILDDAIYMNLIFGKYLKIQQLFN